MKIPTVTKNPRFYVATNSKEAFSSWDNYIDAMNSYNSLPKDHRTKVIGIIKVEGNETINYRVSGYYWIKISGKWMPSLLQRVKLPDATDGPILIYPASGNDDILYSSPFAESEVEEFGTRLIPPE